MENDNQIHRRGGNRYLRLGTPLYKPSYPSKPDRRGPGSFPGQTLDPFFSQPSPFSTRAGRLCDLSYRHPHPSPTPDDLNSISASGGGIFCGPGLPTSCLHNARLGANEP